MYWFRLKKIFDNELLFYPNTIIFKTKISTNLSLDNNFRGYRGIFHTSCTVGCCFASKNILFLCIIPMYINGFLLYIYIIHIVMTSVYTLGLPQFQRFIHSQKSIPCAKMFTHEAIIILKYDRLKYVIFYL